MDPEKLVFAGKCQVAEFSISHGGEYAGEMRAWHCGENAETGWRKLIAQEQEKQVKLR